MIFNLEVARRVVTDTGEDVSKSMERAYVLITDGILYLTARQTFTMQCCK